MELYQDNASRIIELMPTPKEGYGFRLSPLAKRRLARMATDMEKSEAQILEIAITHLLGTLEREQGIWMTAAEPPRKSHKRPPDAA